MCSPCLLLARYREVSVVWRIHSRHTKGSDDQKAVELRSLAELGVSVPKQDLIAGIIEDLAGRRD